VRVWMLPWTVMVGSSNGWGVTMACYGEIK
jgi:hypothetical protein